MQRLSTYAQNLSSDAKARYGEKLAIIGGNDPFLAGSFGEVVDDLPDADSSDLVSYLVLQTSYITAKQYKARKGLDAYNQFVCGWLKDVSTRKVCGKYLITARVSRLTSYFLSISVLAQYQFHLKIKVASSVCSLKCYILF